MLGHLTGRSLKLLKNRHVTKLFTHPSLIGFDGELAAEHHTHPDLCRITTSAVGSYEGEPYVLWWLFDFVTPHTAGMPYSQRLKALQAAVNEAPEPLRQHLRIVPSALLHSMDELEEYDSTNLAAGYEGTIFRDPNGKHKQGRSSPTQGGLLRIKRFIDFEFSAYEIVEGDKNENEAQTNELGHTFRSSHQENKVPNGMIGAVKGYILADVVHEGKTLFERGDEVLVSAGCLTHDQRRHYFLNQDAFFAKIHKAKFFPKGLKDAPRFPTWQTFRDGEDMN